MNLAKLLEEQANRQPDALAIIDGSQSTSQTYRFEQLALDAARSAALLQANGLGKGDRVLVFQPMSYDLYVVLLAVFRLGAVAMFLDPSAGREHINQCCQLGQPKALIAGLKAQLLRLVSPALRHIPVKFVIGSLLPVAVPLRRARQLQPMPGIANCEADTPALLTFTSGSTGQPKAAMRSHGFLLAQHQAIEHALALRPGEVDLTTLPIFLLANLASGLTSVIPNADLRFPGRIKPAPVIKQLTQHQITRTAGSPAFYQRLVTHCENTDTRLTSLLRVDTGGAPVFPDLLKKLQQIAPNANIVSVYGSTEAEPIAHSRWRDISEQDLQGMQSGSGLLSGLPVTEIALRIIPDQFGQPIGPFSEADFNELALPAKQVGEIVVNGAHVLPGYLHGTGDLETKFRVGDAPWHRTGDAGYLDDNGRLWLVGRCTARINDAKGTLYPFCVETAAQFVDGVKRSAMVSHRGRRVLLVESQSTKALPQLEAMLAWADLDEVKRVKQLPVDKRHNAKIDYSRLQELLD